MSLAPSIQKCPPTDPVEMEVCAGVLRAQHAHLDRIYETLLDAYRSGDWTVVHERWDAFEAALRRHIDVEEKHVFPTFEAANPREASALRDEHRALEKLLEVLGVNIELHGVPALDAETLVRHLREHAKREEAVLYPWLESSSFA